MKKIIAITAVYLILTSQYVAAVHTEINVIKIGEEKTVTKETPSLQQPPSVDINLIKKETATTEAVINTVNKEEKKLSKDETPTITESENKIEVDEIIPEEKAVKDIKKKELRTESKKTSTITQGKVDIFSQTPKYCKKIIKAAGLKFNESEFFKQVEKNDTEMTACFLRAGINPNAVGTQGNTPLLWASYNGNIESAKNLTAFGAKVNTANKDGFTPLHAAVESGNAELVNFLTKQGADINAATYADKTTPLHTACYKNDLKSTEYLIKAGADIKKENIHGASAVVTASFYGSSDVLKFLLANGGAANSETGKSPMNAALEGGKSSAVTALADAGADINTKTENGLTPLHSAVINNDYDTVVNLLNKGANPNSQLNTEKDKDITPLHTAVLNENLQIVKALIKSGAFVNAKESLTGSTPIHIAVLKGNEDILAYLLYKDADINAETSVGITPADIALAKKDETMLRHLVINGALFGKNTGLKMVKYGCSLTYKPEKNLYYINCSQALKTLETLETDEDYKTQYAEYLSKTEKFRAERPFTPDKHAYKIYILFFDLL